MSICTAGRCPHDQEAFVWLGDGPWAGDPADPDHGRYPWIHATMLTPGHLQVCDLVPFAAPEECGEACACGCPSAGHRAGPGPVPAGLSARPRPCSCGCPDFRHRPQDLGRRRAVQASLPASPATAPAAPGKARAAATESAQLSLFGSTA